MKTREQLTIELDCSYNTIERYAKELSIEPAKVIKRWHYYSAEQVNKIKAHQKSKKKVGKRAGKQQNGPTCPHWDCIYRGACLMTDKIYTVDCQDYEKEDFGAWLDNNARCRDVLKEKRDAI